jgi:uracil-DNA glycosylase family 4
MIDVNTLTVSGCIKCDISISRTNIVSGRGPTNSDIMIIGESPGALEDRIGIPFVGNSGQILRKILRKFFIEPKNIYITNVVKCRPPNNRMPETIEIRNCLPYLVVEIAKVNPKIILLLGSTALRTFYPTNVGSISKERGKIKIVNNKIVLATYHPSYVLRNKTNLSVVYDFLKDIYLFYRLVKLLP